MWQKIFALLGSCGKWIKTIPSEPNGNGSSSRILGLMVGGTLSGLMIANFVVHKSLPTEGQFYGIAAVLAAGASAYLGNKFGRKDADKDGDQQ